MNVKVHPKSEIRNPMETRNPKPEARNPKRGIGETGNRGLSAYPSHRLSVAPSRFAAAGLAVLLLLAAAGFAHGQGTPSLINYQGTLTDNLGNPVPAGYYEIQFRIWDHPTMTGAGDYIWGRSFPLHVVTNGLFNILLSDDGSQVLTPGTPQAASIRDAFAGPDRFLGLTVARNPLGQVTSPVEISPRQRLVSAPYALQAQNATAASFANNAANAVNLQGTTNDAGNLGILGAHVIEFGRGTAGKEQNAGKIGYNTFSSDSLDIVGAGTTAGNRKIHLWADGGVTASGTVTAPAFSGNGTIPLGGIIMWSGAIANIPSGWALCNGQSVNNQTTPDLRDRFIVGAGSSYAVKDIGGSKNVTLLVANLPAHNHTYADSYFSQVDDTWKGGGDASSDKWTGVSGSTTRTSDSTGSGTPFDVRPPYYALAYIMRVQ